MLSCPSPSFPSLAALEKSLSIPSTASFFYIVLSNCIINLPMLIDACTYEPKIAVSTTKSSPIDVPEPYTMSF